jgi:23S rRNA (adenine2503-C2)-methyltransferase
MSGSSKSHERVDLKTLSALALSEFVIEQGFPKYRAEQLFRWMYEGGVSDFDLMTNLSMADRERLKQVACVERLLPVREQESRDGTIKTLFALPSGLNIETVLIPDFDDSGTATRSTVCVSSQVGCAMGCTFCATGMMGFKENLNSGQIYDQVFLANQLSIERYQRPVSNVVFMGMGEPFLNYDAVLDSISKMTSVSGLGMAPRRITVSTVGLAGRIRDFADAGTRCNLAVSLHAPTDEKRSQIMPVNRQRKTDLEALRSSIVYYTEQTGLGVTYEYCMFQGFNDTIDDARVLSQVARWAPSKINLIMYNPVASTGFKRTSESDLNQFIGTLVKKRIRVTVRRSRGQDIDAACGQLAAKE